MLQGKLVQNGKLNGNAANKAQVIIPVKKKESEKFPIDKFGGDKTSSDKQASEKKVCSISKFKYWYYELFKYKMNNNGCYLDILPCIVIYKYILIV